MTRNEAAALYESHDLSFADGARIRVIDIVEVGTWVTVLGQRINRDNSIDKRDARPRNRSFIPSAITAIDGVPTDASRKGTCSESVRRPQAPGLRGETSWSQTRSERCGRPNAFAAQDGDERLGAVCARHRNALDFWLALPGVTLYAIPTLPTLRKPRAYRSSL